MLRVKGGPANSGTKLPMQPQHPPWMCSNGHPNRGFCTRCLHQGCNQERPK